jgi:hypothetical protein
MMMTMMMSRVRKHKWSTDYLFESAYNKAKVMLFSTHLPSKLAALKVLAIVSWFKDIN